VKMEIGATGAELSGFLVARRVGVNARRVN
jgi:hypothetical protein